MPQHPVNPLLLSAFVLACSGKAVDLDALDGSGQGRGGPSSSSPVTVVTAPQNEHVLDIAVDEERLYWATGYPFDYGARTLRSCSKRNCATTVTTYPSDGPDFQRKILEFKVQESTVYWLAEDQLPNTSIMAGDFLNIWACATTGCSEPRMIVPGAGFFFAVDANEIYYSSRALAGPPVVDSRFLLACPSTGCVESPRQLPAWGADGPRDGLVMDRDSLVWVNRANTLMRLKKDGSSEPELVGTGLRNSGRVVMNERHVYWPVFMLAGAIHRCELPDCSQGIDVVANQLRRPRHLIVRDNELFFQHQNQDGAWDIVSCPVDNCVSPHRIGTFRNDDTYPDNAPMAIDEDHVYVVVPDSNSGWGSINVQRFQR